MLKLERLIVAVAIGSLALPTLAGSWPPTPPRKVEAEAAATLRTAPAQKGAEVPRAIGGFEFVGGEPGWQLAQHKYLLVAGRFAHSDECDHAIRMVSAPTPADIESTRGFSPGA